MADNFLQRALKKPQYDEPAPLGGSRNEAIQRLQIGMIGIISTILVVGLADVIQEHANRTNDRSVPQVTATVEAEPEPAQQSDPLSAAGVVPDGAATSEPETALEPRGEGLQEAVTNPEGTVTGEVE